jgi:hypothetical protein
VTTFGPELLAELDELGDFTIPSRVSVAWELGTPAAAPFFRAEIRSLAPAQ